ncbi:CSLREA domain-containing protein [Acinetobacter sp. 187]|uniref:CSLREA domain-containing protein n=1 Tax=Acinetobacter lanii TaxID=2715163 RepID=UPI001407F621|nr:CSLREA domain-containing protein [Acinetobacter lanii]NHC04257.1 CSLREA domain-containing protein [Acinetobacter lanii]
MKNYKKGLLTLMVLSAMSLMAAEDMTIYVTTFEDEDGENSSKCSLREAVTAASTHQAYGGCPKGQSYQTNTNVIQLEEGTYKLNKELSPNASMVITGKAPSDFTQRDVITNDYPALTPIKTVISAQGKSRIFNTTNLNRPALTLSNLTLTDAVSDSAGGALFLGGKTELSNVSIQNTQAATGGAIYLNDVNSAINITGGEFRNNQANTGSVLAMSCMDNLNYTAREINISGATLIQNGNQNSQSMLAFCGQPTAVLTSNTLTENTANANSGDIIMFSSNKGDNKTNLSGGSTLKLLSNTIVKNSAQSVLLYNAIGTKTIYFNILGFNSGKSCVYNDGDVSEIDSANINLESNALSLSKNDVCQLPVKTLEYAQSHSILLDDQNIANVLSPLQVGQNYTAFLPMYFPIDSSTKTDLVDVGTTGCAELDQRGFSRINDNTVDGNGNALNSCDIGSTEVLKLTVKEIKASNLSVLETLKGYQDEYNLFKGLIDNKDTKAEYIPYYKIRMQEYEDLINYTKSEQKYRTIFINPFAANLPDETILSSGARQIRHLNSDNYDVTTQVVGVGKLDSNNQFIGSADPNLKCEWNAKLKRILMYRTDDHLTPSGDNEICKYTLTDKLSKKASSSYLQTTFVNIAPTVPAEISVNVQHGGNQKVSVNLLKDANDNGDGNVAALLSNPNKSAFFLNELGQDQAIRFIKIPDAVSVTADRKGACPGLDKKNDCYGGNISLQLNNSLDVFNYKVEYAVYDADGSVSNTGILNLKNSALAQGSPRTSGGGSMGWFSLFGLLALAAVRQYRSRAQ